MQELVSRILELKSRLQKAWQLIDVGAKRQKIIDLHEKMSGVGFWQDQNEAKKISQEVNDLEGLVSNWEEVNRGIQDLLDVAEMDKADQSVNLRVEAEAQLVALKKKFNQLEFELLLSGKYDHCSAILAIHAGAGGTDAQDWAEMLLRMYLRFVEKRGWRSQILSISSGSEAGVKSVVFEVEGRNSYGYLKSENGVHRLVRISPFDAEKMRHTSFALVEVLPMLEDELEVGVKPEDLRVDTFHAGGHGGQSVNTTDSAVRITHLPTGIVVSCQNERSQQQNKEKALKIFRAKLQQYYETEVEEERQKLRGEYTEAAWGNQARSYVIHPYKMVKDHRTQYETANVEAVLDGDLTEFIEAYLRANVSKK